MKQKLRLGDYYALTKHKPKHQYIRYISLLAVLTTMCLYARAQRPDDSGPVLSGIVTDTSGIAVAGATVVIKGVSKRTHTDNQGRFTLRSPKPSGVLVISHLGYHGVNERFGNNNAGPFRFILISDENILEEVEINTGYQRITPLQSTGAVDVVDTKLLNRAVGPNIMDRIENLTTGISSEDYIELERYLFEQGYYTADVLMNDFNLLRTPLTPVVETLVAHNKGLLSDRERNDRLAYLSDGNVYQDLYDYFYHEGVQQQHSLSVSGANRSISYYFSAGYDRNISPTVGTGNDRLTLKSQNNFRLTDKLGAQLGITYTQTGAHTARNAAENLTLGVGKRLYPYARLADENRDPLPVVHTLRSLYTDTAGGGALLDWKYYPLAEIQDPASGSDNQENILTAGRKAWPRLPAMKAYLRAWNAKVRPVLLTVLSTMLGFIPFLVGDSKEAFWFPLAVGTIGGLLDRYVGDIPLSAAFYGGRENGRAAAA